MNNGGRAKKKKRRNTKEQKNKSKSAKAKAIKNLLQPKGRKMFIYKLKGSHYLNPKPKFKVHLKSK